MKLSLPSAAGDHQGILQGESGMVKGCFLTLIHHQGIISPAGRDFTSSSGVAFDRSSVSRLKA
jgi:hypothetical protein